ncbi:MAG: radical SAM family heme chaperone HemW [Ignavibacteria bacterium]|nr:radical SAM family heme chaperone HemW [Ignavibacteria bacterium]MBT8381575.1 radical SAM family heme chaperone HemW [Ignavibacteria bacterium]MBT8391965.1 radical SAM family heme chaperone HemW [Ignavibacteria bacterium]NNJ53175.1 radical SAM family heme chaperone HemW [Ignavibacteriaceae bacterium]NNL21026.1 radical SAM family heme chaperone HemW [Ignavibacteriaceae bacterium]
MIKTACYIHIPFCDHKCIYCDFYSIITSDNINPFLKSIEKEINYFSSKHSKNRELISIYFGGGTPSLMETDYIKQIICLVKKNFTVNEAAEITIETNPGTVSLDKLKRFKESGINRISIGIQSFDDEELKFLTRIHNYKTAIETVNNAYNAGFGNISIDLIFNLPNQTKKKWKENLVKAIDLPIKHISAYSLILERGTILNKMVLDGKVELQDADYDANLYETTIEFLDQKGFYQYEVSNFTKPDYECVHNNAYWRYGEYFGLGTSAHSFINKKRWWNFSSLKKYISEIELCGQAIAGSEIITAEKELDEYVMLALRSSGLNLNEFSERFGVAWLEKKNSYFNLLEKKKLLEITNGSIKLTGTGYAVCDEILKEIL